MPDSTALRSIRVSFQSEEIFHSICAEAPAEPEATPSAVADGDEFTVTDDSNGAAGTAGAAARGAMARGSDVRMVARR